MAEGKYYWLKLKEDFFRQKEIKKLRRIAGGDTYTIIYLKMQLLSLKNEGLLYYEGTEETFEDQLSLEIDEDLENVKLTLAFLFSNNLIEEANNEYLLPKVSECIGKEGSSAKRVRKYRERQNAKQLEGQSMLQCNAEVTKCNIEKEKELEKDIDIEKELEKENKSSSCCSNTKVFKHFEKCGILNSVTSEPKEYSRLMEFIAADIKVYGSQWLMDAADEAVKRGKYKYSYVQGILQNWKADGREKNGTTSKPNENTRTEEGPKYDFTCYD